VVWLISKVTGMKECMCYIGGLREFLPFRAKEGARGVRVVLNQ
jgi:hypothetical protein